MAKGLTQGSALNSMPSSGKLDLSSEIQLRILLPETPSELPCVSM